MSIRLDDNVQDRLLLAVPKKGRLHEAVISLLKRSGIKYNKKNRLDIAYCTTLDVALVFLPAHDIGVFVSEGRVDAGITGQDVVKEVGAHVDELLPLGFGKCHLALQAPVDSSWQTPKDFIGKRIVTSFPNLSRHYFEKFPGGNTTQIHYVSGSVEVACNLGVADAVVDLVETGDTMRAAGLKEVSIITPTEAVLISNPKSEHKDLINMIKHRFEGVIHADIYVMLEYNIQRNLLAEVVRITPGKKSPTISPLDNPDWVAVKVLVKKEGHNKVLDDLQRIGAQDILVYHIQNCRV